MRSISLILVFIVLLPLSLSAGRLPVSDDLIGTWKIMDISYVKVVKLFNKDHADSLVRESANYVKEHEGAIIVFKLDSTFTYQVPNSKIAINGKWLILSDIGYVRPTMNSRTMQKYDVQLAMEFDEKYGSIDGYNGAIQSFDHKKQNFIFFDGRYKILFKRIK